MNPEIDKCKNGAYCMKDKLLMAVDCRTCNGWSGKHCLRVAKCELASGYVQRTPIQAWFRSDTVI